jgi:arylsulfatase A-like enzyme
MKNHPSRFFALLSLCSALAAPGLAAKPKNVVFMLADDLGWGELGCYGQKKIHTPNIDQLAAEGTRFAQHYAGAPVCAPARCVLMTGRHLGHAEIRGNRQAHRFFPQFKVGQYPISAGLVTLAEAFKNAGFATGAMGKWGLGPVGSTGDPNKQGFDTFVGYNCQAVAHSYYPRHIWYNDKQVEINKHPIPGHARQPKGKVTMDKWIGDTYSGFPICEAGVKFIQDHKDKPFFLYLPFTEPHVAMHPPKKSVEEYPEDWDKEPYRGQCAYLPHPRPHAGYAAMITMLDEHVGKVVAELKKQGIYDDTLVVFTSDNGTTHYKMGGDHREGGTIFGIGGVDAEFFNSVNGLRGLKGSVYEGGIRVPMIVRYPAEVKAGALDENTVGYFADWYPTLCAAMGVEAPADAVRDGENLWPDITGKEKQGKRKPLVWVYPEYGGQVAVRIGDFKVVRRELKTKKPGDWEVYNLASDRNETTDIAKDHPEVVKQAIGILKKQMSPNKIFPLKVPGVND